MVIAKNLVAVGRHTFSWYYRPRHIRVKNFLCQRIETKLYVDHALIIGPIAVFWVRDK